MNKRLKENLKTAGFLCYAPFLLVGLIAKAVYETFKPETEDDKTRQALEDEWDRRRERPDK